MRILSAIVGLGWILTILLGIGIVAHTTKPATLTCDSPLVGFGLPEPEMTGAGYLYRVDIEIPLTYYVSGEQADIRILTPKGETWCVFVTEKGGRLEW